MATAAATPVPGIAAPGRSPWLFGPLPDLLLGCGLGYGVVFAALMSAGPSVRGAIPFEYGPLVLLLSGTPHYGATLLRVYDRAEDRRAYALFSVWATAVLAALFVAALHQPLLGSLLLTLMLTWSPWHYTGQNYGIALMFLRRGGVPIAPRTKRLVYASFFLSFLLTVLAVHGATPAGQYAPTGFGGSSYRFLPLGLPDAWRRIGFAAIGSAYLLTTIAAALALLRVARVRALLPAAALVATQSLWFAVPALARYYGIGGRFEPLGLEHAAYAFLWVAVGHSLQYLWISLYYARQRDAGTGSAGYLARCLLAGAAIWTVPALLFAPGALGAVPYDLGLAVLVSTVVNLHHFVLDGAIWKLRDGRVAQVLLRARGEAAAAPVAPGRRRTPWRPLVWAAGAASVLVIVGSTLESEWGFRRAIEAGDAVRAERSLARLAWLGRDGPSLRASLALVRARAGDLEAARGEVEAALERWDVAELHVARGWIEQMRGDPARAIGAYARALELDPDRIDAANNLAWLRATTENPMLSAPQQATELAAAAARATGFRDPRPLDTLAAAHAAGMRFADAARWAERAAALARERGDAAFAAQIDARAALYRSGQRYVESAEAVAQEALAAGAPTLTPARRLQ